MCDYIQRLPGGRFANSGRQPITHDSIYQMMKFEIDCGTSGRHGRKSEKMCAADHAKEGRSPYPMENVLSRQFHVIFIREDRIFDHEYY